MIDWLADQLIRHAASRAPDFMIGTKDDPYLLRWYLTPWSNYQRGTRAPTRWQAIQRKLPNVYLHFFRRSDDDRALHDHPWANASLLLRGAYVEHSIEAGGVHRRTQYSAGDIKLRGPRTAHRIEIADPCWTLFVTGPVVRNWGFHCPQGWRPWQVFVDDRDSGQIGRGCE